MAFRKRSTFLFSHIDATVHGTERAIAIAKGQAIDVEQVIGKDADGRNVTVRHALGTLIEGFTEDLVQTFVGLPVPEVEVDPAPEQA